MYFTLLFYKYTLIQDPETFVAEHLKFCQDLGLHGRILVAKEGINGSVSGTKEQIETYKSTLRNLPEFAGIEFKEGGAEDHIFQKMHVRLRKEICALKLEDDVDPLAPTDYIEPEEVHEILKNEDKDYIFIDTRNNYEWKSGKFKNALTLDIEYFRDFPAAVKEIENLKDKKVITYCTGGIRCEKAARYLQKVGFKNVRQIHGGILRYGEKTDGYGWEGNCFMFDDRLGVPINKSEDACLISECSHCHTLCDRYRNCSNVDCNILYISCEECDEKLGAFCSETCSHATRTRERNPVRVVAVR